MGTVGHTKETNLSMYCCLGSVFNVKPFRIIINIIIIIIWRYTKQKLTNYEFLTHAVISNTELSIINHHIKISAVPKPSHRNQPIHRSLVKTNSVDR